MNAVSQMMTERRRGSRAYVRDGVLSKTGHSIDAIQTIFVIDDVAINVAVLSATLKKLDGVDVVGFSSGSDALAACNNIAADLVFVDYQMPGMDGVEFIEQFRSLPGNALVPIVVVTGDDESDLLSRALDAGAHDFLRKPVDRVELSARARTMLRLSDANRQLARYAEIDELTGLCNRRSFLASTATTLDRNETEACCALAIFDIDFFKSVNDRFGHPGGDAVLRDVASRLRQVVSRPNLWGRLGGEEFGLLMPSAANLTDALVFAEHARCALLSGPVRLPNGLEVDVTLSGGVALAEPGDDPLRWLARADAALYEAKRDGRNCVKVAS